MNDNSYYVYIIASIRRTIYTGMTRDISTRLDQHKSGRTPGFSAKYRANQLVWCEIAESFDAAQAREKEIKGWRRSKKISLIERENPFWEDLTARLVTG
jgi:putative endonuclease